MFLAFVGVSVLKNKRKESKKMKKRMIALFLTLAMLVSIAPAVVADDTVPRPTVEEILDEYHQKVFEAQNAGEAAAYSPRSGSSGKTLEQETVDALNAAGYEAYNVTGENYEALEDQLKTDFSDMGLDPNSSYIIAISGEESENNTAGMNSRAIVPVDPGGGGGDGSFTYTYNGATYRLRYVTVTPDANESGMQVKSSYIFHEQSFIQAIGRNIFNTIIVTTMDKALPDCKPLGTIASIFFDVPDDYLYVDLNLEDVELRAHTVWTYNFIQVWNEFDQTWDTSQCSEYATSAVWRVDSIYDPATGYPIPTQSTPQYSTHYSSIYYDTAQRCLAAMKAYDHYTLSVNCVYYVHFYFSDETGTANYDASGETLFTHYRSTSITLPDTD